MSAGKLLLIDNSIDQATATIRLKAMLDNADERLWPGEFVNARVLLETPAATPSRFRPAELGVPPQIQSAPRLAQRPAGHPTQPIGAART